LPERLSGALSLLPTAATSAFFVALAWREQGSILAEDWLPYALATGLLVAVVIASGAALRPRSACLAGLGALAALALWTALSASWSSVPALARDEALLVLFYAVALAIPLVTLWSEAERLGAIAIVAAGGVSLVVATSLRLITADDPAEFYWSTRLGWPIRYPGAEAAIFLVSFWPAAAVAASRRLNLAFRTIAFAGTVALLAGWLMTQSRAGAVSLAASAVLVFAVAPARLRLLVPVALAAALAGAAYGPLTEPFQKEGQALAEAVEDAGRWALAVSLAGIGVGLVYALADRRLAVSPRFVRATGVAALAVAVCVGLVGLGGFLVAVDKPGDYVHDRWQEFKRAPESERGSSHLVTIGSNRYDTWRVALNEFREHPVAGAGGRAFGAAYLRDGKTEETPQRAHSLELDLLSETGLVGLGLFVAGLAPFAWIILRRARSSLIATGVVGGGAYWLVHASGDWTWTFPAAGVPFFLLLGAGAAGEGAGLAKSVARKPRISSWAALPLGVSLAAAALLAFAPPWLSARYTARALEQPAPEAADELQWARRLDPLSTEAELADSPAQAIPPLVDAVGREPRSVALRYLLGLAYLDTGRPQDARRELREAQRLSPRSEAVQRALRRARAELRNAAQLYPREPAIRTALMRALAEPK
jgi:O-Antigen ligase/Tetratricopeptide repeat